MYYTIRHLTRFRYSAPISQSVMESRMQPRTEGSQRSLSFQLSVSPAAKVLNYRDYLGNVIHNFDIPGEHRQLSLTAQSQVEVRPHAPLPDRLPPGAWDELSKTEYDMLVPSHFTHPTPLLHALGEELDVVRHDDPLSLLKEITAKMYDAFDYVPESTAVDSPIDDALRARQGVCQDYTHIMLALLRPLGIPARYVSGYLYSHVGETRSTPGASHAWVEALLPGLGWIGFDPTNNLIADLHHIRVAIGRDYADVPPTRGIFKGKAETELSVSVRVTRADEPPAEDTAVPAHWTAMSDSEEKLTAQELYEQQQQQQQ
jgi:transglutaminase-like putative cysteine protease